MSCRFVVAMEVFAAAWFFAFVAAVIFGNIFG